MDDDALREHLAKNAKEKAMNNFSIEKSVSETIKVYEKALGAFNESCVHSS